MVHQPLGERGRQHQLALGSGDEGIAQAVEPELGPAGLADAGIEMVRVLDVAGRAGRRREHPLADAFGQIRDGVLAPLENGGELTGDGKLQGHAGLGLLDPERERVHVDPLPPERQHLVPAHAGVEPEPEGVADRQVVDFGLDAGAPARQHLRLGRNLAPRLAVELAAAGKPEIDRVAQSIMVDAGPAVDRAQQGHRPVGGRPAMVGGEGAVEFEDDALVGRLPAAVAGPVVDDEGLGPRGLDADAEARELVVPGDPGLLGRLEGVDGPLGERPAHLCGAFSGAGVHAGNIAIATVRFTVDTTINTRKELVDTG